MAWRTRAFWLRAFLCLMIGGAFLIMDEASNYDLRFAIRGSRSPDPRIVLIDIPERDWTSLQDEASRNMIRPLKEIMNFNDSFFWNAEIWETLLTTVLAENPKAVGVALYFGDNVRTVQLSEEQKVVFADPRLVWGADLDAAGRALVPEFTTTYGAQSAIKHLRADDDGIVRRFSSSLVKIPGMPLMLARLASPVDGRLHATNRWETPQLINYMGPAGTYITLNIRDVLDGRVPLEILRDKVIIIGSRTSPIDQLQTPVGRMSRAEALANITDNIIGNKTIVRLPKLVYLAGLALLMLFSISVLNNYPQTVALITFVWTGTLLAAISAWTFDSYFLWLPVLSPVLQLGFTYIIFLSYQLSQNEQKTWRLEQERRYLLDVRQAASKESETVKILQGVGQMAAPFVRSVLTIGNFDGIHLGHRELIRRTRECARSENAPAIVMTFDPHPVQVLHPERHLKRLFSLEDQRRELEKLGVDVLVLEPFSREFSQLSPERYLLEWVFRPFSPKLVVVGYDFSFGANKSGTLDFLRTKAAQLGFEVEVVPPVKVGEHLVSSSRVRKALVEGDVNLAAALLGRRFYIEGIVEKGAGRGRTIGVPTANLRTPAETVPAEGVYAAWADVGGQRWKAAVNIGRNPTFQAGERSGAAVSIEAHLLGFNQDIYGMPLRLEFVRRLREERKFPGKDALVSQIRQDIAEAEKILDGSG